MHTVTIEISNKDALKTLQALEQKHFIKIVETTETDSPALPGKPVSIAAFQSWISASEKADTISLTEAKLKWASRKKTTAKNYQVRLSDYAQQNIKEITGYVAFINQQPNNAIKIGDKIFEAFDRIALHPLAFKECEYLPTKKKVYRRAVVMSWLIIYKIQDNDILILGILHSSRKPSIIKRLKRTL